jgi:hypothetical protein
MADNNTGLIVASIVGGVAVLGIGGYLIVKSGKDKATPAPSASSNNNDSIAAILAKVNMQQSGQLPSYNQQQPVVIQQSPKSDLEIYGNLGLEALKIFMGSKKSKTDNSTVFVDDSSANTTAYNDMGYGELPAGGGVLASPSSGYGLDYGSMWSNNSYGV